MITISAHFKNPTANTSVAFRPNVELVKSVVGFLQQSDPLGKQWYLMGDTEADSLLYPAFESSGELTTAAEAVLETEFKGQDFRYLGVWNGEFEEDNGATMALHFSNQSWPLWNLDIKYPEKSIHRLGGLNGVLTLLSTIASSLRPAYITVARNEYFEKQVFQDRPGVGWMLYLPRALTAKQVPEARSLVPVFDADKKQIGTIMVSVNDEPFSDENPEHIKIANAIEIRLVDQDLLPCYADL